MSSSASTDHFSAVATAYADFRPDYPPELWAWLTTQVPAEACVWEPGCGSGQATLALAERFAKIYASDLSAEQIALAPQHPRVQYSVAPGHRSAAADQSIDLIVVAQALHWFDMQRFCAEAERVLRPNGMICAFTYGIMVVHAQAANAVLEHYYHDVVGPYWPSGREHVTNGYANLHLPFEVLNVPEFAISRRWSIAHLFGYVQSWSATTRYRQARGSDPIPALAEALIHALDGQREVDAHWPLTVKANRRTVAVERPL